ncbi:MAG: peroxidase family protein [Bacteroidota bacterium]
MKKLFTLLFAWTAFFTFTHAQEVRTYDGSNNNLANPKWGATFTELVRIAPAAYADKIAAPAGAQRQNPRKISNALFSQPTGIPDQMGLSDFVWAFGQFIDHDITLTESGRDEPAMIEVNFPDQQFNPDGTRNVMIPMFRNKVMEGTGTSEDNPREHFNEITAWLDGSAVYGSDAFRATWLRSLQDGKLKVSSGNLLPFDTQTGELNAPADPDAPHMGDDVGLSERLFVAGDPRANENVILASYHTLFVREHNRICDELILQHPEWEDEQLYQHARKIVGGIIQRITFDEWLPVMGIDLAPYAGYNPEANPSIINGFSAAAFRLGHTLLSGDILVMDEEGNERLEGAMRLRDVFFNPISLIDNGGIDPFFRGMGAQMQQRFDAKIVDDIRSFLFGAPGAGGLDLAAININRGRERGIADFNSYRAALGLEKYTNFRQICEEVDALEALQSNYSSVDDIDAWVGMLAEEPNEGNLFGETVSAFMKLQFELIRDGDRFYYEIDPTLSEAEKTAIRSTTMRDVLMRNTNIHIMQDNVFKAKHPTSICGFYGESARLQGIVTNEFGSIVLNVEVEVNDEQNRTLSSAISDGTFSVDDIATCEEVSMKLAKNDSYDNGITTLDMVLILKHILNIDAFDTPYKIIAADVNNSKSVSASDLVAIRKLILGTETNFPNETPSWRFINADYNFLDDNPLDEELPEVFRFNLNKDSDVNFVAVKMGDVNGTADHTTAVGGNEFAAFGESRSANKLTFHTADMAVEAGNTYSIPFSAASKALLVGYQFTMMYDEAALTFEGLGKSTTLKNGNTSLQKNQLRVSWNHFEGVAANDLDFELNFTAQQNGLLSDFLTINSRPVKAEAYDENLDVMPISLDFSPAEAATFQLLQNQPNPFDKVTNIGFSLPESSSVELSIYDAAGKELQLIEGDYDQGFHNISINAADLRTSGVLYYELKTDFGNLTKKMVVKTE